MKLLNSVASVLMCGEFLSQLVHIQVGTILRNGTERNDGLNYGTERFLKLKRATYHC